MLYRYSVISWAMFVSAILATVVAAIIWRRRKAPSAGYLIGLELAAAQWTLCAAFEMAATTAPLKQLWTQISYPGTTTTSVFFFLFAMMFSQRNWRLPKWTQALLFVIPLLVTAIGATNFGRHLVWSNVSQPDPITNLSVYSHGPLFWVFIAYVYCLLIIGVILLLRSASRYPKFYRSQSIALLIGALLPITGNVLYIAGISPIPGLDLTPVAFLISGVALSWGMLRLRMLDLAPVARDTLLDIMPDGVLVLDQSGRIVDLNPVMQKLVGLSVRQAIGRDAEEALSGWKELLSILRWDDIVGDQEISLQRGEERRYFDVRLTCLTDPDRQVSGRLIVLRETTLRRRLEEERRRLIEEQQQAQAQINTLSELLPMCANCKRIRDENGHWHDLEEYLAAQSGTEVSHGICPECMRQLYPRFCSDEAAKSG